MIDINELRQSLGAVQPEEVSELLDRLEEAEAEALEQARLNGMGSEREAALMAKLKAAERERDDVAQQLVQAEIGKRKLDAECNALRAKLEAAKFELRLIAETYPIDAVLDPQRAIRIAQYALKEMES